MFQQNFIDISPDLINLILVVIFSLIIGLELRQHSLKAETGDLFGTDRTHVFIGLLGYILWLISPDESHWLFILGGMSLVILIAIYYWHKITRQNQYGVTTLIVSLITYSLPALIYTQKLWMSFAVVSLILVFIELKGFFRKLTKQFDENEFINLAKFLLISGIILPLLSHNIISERIPVSPFKIWLSVVAISGISYISYLIKKFIFPGKGALITGILGGLYSSTATTIVLSKKSKKDEIPARKTVAAIIIATGMMYIRIWILAFIFNEKLAYTLATDFGLLTALSFLTAWVIYNFDKEKKPATIHTKGHPNPLELKTAIFFALLFVIFSVLTQFVVEHFGHKGLQILSFVTGITDVDPFLLSLFTGKYHTDISVLSQATLIAVASNNLMKMIYAVVLGSQKIKKIVIAGFSIIILVNIVLAFL